MNQLTTEKRTQIIASLVEGNSIRATCRMTDTAKGTVLKLLREVGMACKEYQDKTLRFLPCKRIQCDEVWSFCYAKEANVPADKKDKFGYGNVWTWTAICADTKLVPCWAVGSRDLLTAMAFMKDLKRRLKNRVQLTTDGWKAYDQAVNHSFGCDVDYAMIDKVYTGEAVDRKTVRYSPTACIGAQKKLVNGNPDMNHVSTSFAERNNLTMRMGMRRFTRLTNAFSKKVENLEHSLALHFMHYNFCRIHKSLRVTPAMAAGVSQKLWEIEDIVGLLDQFRKNKT